MPSLVEKEVRYDQLLLDPNNYRFHDTTDFGMTDERRFAEENVQKRAFTRLQDDSLQQLKNSILRNGFLTVERIVVRAFAHAQDTYVVVEGNRRLAALRWIVQDNDAGIAIPKEVMASVQKIPVLVSETPQTNCSTNH